MKILITGICGFVGSTIAKKWVEHGYGHTVFGIDNFIRSGTEINRLPLNKIGIKVLHADLRCISDIENLPDADFVIDAAANPCVLAGADGLSTSRQLLEHNLTGTVNILEYCKSRKAGLILLSTSRVYSIITLSSLDVETFDGAFRPVFNSKTPEGITPEGITEAFSTQPPVSLYGASKLASEILALEYGEEFDFPVWINRCGILAGAGQFGRPDQGILSFWINAWLKKHPLNYIGFGGYGYQVRDCLHPRDLISLLETQMRYSGDSKLSVQNVSGGIESAFSLKQLSAWCRDRFGKFDIQSQTDPRPLDIPWLILNSNLAKKQWNWSPVTTREEILEEIAVHAEKNPNWLELSSACYE